MKAHFKASSLLTCKMSHDCQTEFIFQPSSINYISRYSNTRQNKQEPIIGADKEGKRILVLLLPHRLDTSPAKRRSKMKKKRKEENHTRVITSKKKFTRWSLIWVCFDLWGVTLVVGEAYVKCSRQLMQPPLHLPVCSMMLLEQWGWLPLQTQRRKKKKDRAGEAPPQELPKSIFLQPAAKRLQHQPSPAGSLTPFEATFLNCACHKAPSPPTTSTQPVTAAGLAATRGPSGRPGLGSQSFGAAL